MKARPFIPLALTLCCSCPAIRLWAPRIVALREQEDPACFGAAQEHKQSKEWMNQSLVEPISLCEH